jgi:hypothetical protein
MNCSIGDGGERCGWKVKKWSEVASGVATT